MKRTTLAVASLLSVGLLLTGAATASAATVVTATDADHKGWDFSQTRLAGHWEFKPAALHVYTDDATSQAKVAGYVPVNNVALTTVAGGTDPALNYEPTAGPTPGYQLKVKYTTALNVTYRFILVGEPVYAGKWWAADCSDFCAALGMPSSGGGGSAYQGTLDEWAVKLPKAKVTDIGFSLGSGVKGDGLLKSLTFVGTTYRFAKAAPVTTPPTTTPATTTAPTTAPTTTPTTSGTTTPTTSGTTTQAPPPAEAPVVVNDQFEVIPNVTSGVNTGDGSLAAALIDPAKLKASILASSGESVSVTSNRIDQGGIGVNRGNGGTEYEYNR